MASLLPWAFLTVLAAASQRAVPVRIQPGMALSPLAPTAVAGNLHVLQGTEQAGRQVLIQDLSAASKALENLPATAGEQALLQRALALDDLARQTSLAFPSHSAERVYADRALSKAVAELTAAQLQLLRDHRAAVDRAFSTGWVDDFLAVSAGQGSGVHPTGPTRHDPSQRPLQDKLKALLPPAPERGPLVTSAAHALQAGDGAAFQRLVSALSGDGSEAAALRRLAAQARSAADGTAAFAAGDIDFLEYGLGDVGAFLPERVPGLRVLFQTPVTFQHWTGSGHRLLNFRNVASMPLRALERRLSGSSVQERPGLRTHAVLRVAAALSQSGLALNQESRQGGGALREELARTFGPLPENVNAASRAIVAATMKALGFSARELALADALLAWNAAPSAEKHLNLPGLSPSDDFDLRYGFSEAVRSLDPRSTDAVFKTPNMNADRDSVHSWQTALNILRAKSRRPRAATKPTHAAGQLQGSGFALAHAALGFPTDGVLRPNAAFGTTPLGAAPRQLVEFSWNGVIDQWNSAPVVVLVPFDSVPKGALQNVWYTATSHLGAFTIPAGSAVLLRKGLDVPEEQLQRLQARGISVSRFESHLTAAEAADRSLTAEGYEARTLQTPESGGLGMDTTWLDETTGQDPAAEGDRSPLPMMAGRLARMAGAPSYRATDSYPLGRLQLAMEQLWAHHNWHGLATVNVGAQSWKTALADAKAAAEKSLSPAVLASESWRRMEADVRLLERLLDVEGEIHRLGAKAAVVSAHTSPSPEKWAALAVTLAPMLQRPGTPPLPLRNAQDYRAMLESKLR